MACPCHTIESEVKYYHGNFQGPVAQIQNVWDFVKATSISVIGTLSIEPVPHLLMFWGKWTGAFEKELVFEGKG